MQSLTRIVISFLAVSTLALVAVAGPEHLSSGSKEVMAAPAPPAPSWSGFYFGLNGGAAFGGDTDVNTDTTPDGSAGTFGNEAIVAATLVGNSEHNDDGQFLGGITAGYNMQFSQFVLGAETDIDGSTGNVTGHHDASSGVPAFPTETIFSTEKTTRNLEYIGTLRARLGWLPFQNLLLFGSGGLAYGGVSSSASFRQQDIDTSFPAGTCPYCVPYGSRGSFHDTEFGWTVGGGLEWMFAPRWSLKAEYLYYDLGSASYSVSPLVSRFSTAFGGNPAGSTAFSTNTIRATTNFNGNIVRAGLNFHF
jgi:outer membrane immunogenic protein